MMRLALIFAFLSAAAATAAAQTAACRMVENSVERLACYDKASPPVESKGAMAKQMKDPDPAPRDRGSMEDFLASENARLDAKIKNICRGC